MKKYICLIICLCMIFGGCSSENNENNKNNYFGGKGILKSDNQYNSRQVIYDDINTYNRVSSIGYVCLDENENVYVMCNDASCTHTTGECMASTENYYFVFKEVLYNAKGRSIVKCDTKEEVFICCIPEEYLKDEERNYQADIKDVFTIDDKYIIIRAGGFVYILDSEFNIVLYHNNISTSTWAMVKDNKYYYLNDLCEIITIDLGTKVEEKFEIDSVVYRAYNNDSYLFYTDKYMDFYRVNLDDGEKVKIYTGIYDALVTDKYIYFDYLNSLTGATGISCIIDVQGNLIKEIDGTALSADFGWARYANGKIYINGYSENDNPTLVVMDEDGENLKVYEIRN